MWRRQPSLHGTAEVDADPPRRTREHLGDHEYRRPGSLGRLRPFRLAPAFQGEESAHLGAAWNVPLCLVNAGHLAGPLVRNDQIQPPSHAMDGLAPGQQCSGRSAKNVTVAEFPASQAPREGDLVAVAIRPPSSCRCPRDDDGAAGASAGFGPACRGGGGVRGRRLLRCASGCSRGFPSGPRSRGRWCRGSR